MSWPRGRGYFQKGAAWTKAEIWQVGFCWGWQRSWPASSSGRRWASGWVTQSAHWRTKGGVMVGLILALCVLGLLYVGWCAIKKI